MRSLPRTASAGILVLACCLSLESARGEEDLFGLPADAAPEELYWEVLRLRSGEVLSEQTFAQVQRELDVVDAHYAADRDYDEQVRRVLVGALRRTYRTVPQDESAHLHAAQEGRAHARRLHSAGVREGEKYAQRTVFIAGMLGMPTSKGELALVVALPAGGYLVGKVAALTYKRAALLLRNLRTPDEVLSRTGALGVRVQRVESKAELERALGRDAGASLDAAPRASESVAIAANKPQWRSWGEYEKVTVGGREYARIGDRLYTRHAVDRLQPSGLGTPAGGGPGPGRSISPTFVEDVIQNGTTQTQVVNGVERTVHTSGTVQIVTEQGGRVVITVNPFSGGP